MTAKIQTQLQLADNFMVVRDKLATILLEESAKQQDIARAGGLLDPELFRFRVYSERANPVELYIFENSAAVDVAKLSPIVNIWWSKSEADGNRSDIIKRQEHAALFNLDCYGCGIATATSAGHAPGDQLAALNAQRCAALVRQILMAAHYVYLGDPALVGKRWVESLETFQPAQDERPVQRVDGVRVRVTVSFNEFSPQIQPVTLAAVQLTVTRAPDGEMTLLEATFPTPAQDP